MNFNKKICSLFLTLLIVPSVGQDIPIGAWRSHLSYSSGQIMELAHSRVFCAMENGLFSVNLENDQISKHTTENGLSDTRVTALKFVPFKNLLLIGYESGKIDVLTGSGELENLRTLYEAPIIANKSIRDIESKDKHAFLATDFGVIVLDLVNLNFRDNFRHIGPEGEEVQTNSIKIREDSLYISTNMGIQSGHLSDNLLDFNKWRHYAQTDETFGQLTQWNERLFAIRDEENLWELISGEWADTGISASGAIRRLYSSEKLIALTSNTIEFLLPNESSLDVPSILKDGTDIVLYEGNYLVSDAENGIFYVNEGLPIRPTGPLRDDPSKIKWVNGSIYFLYGPNPQSFNGMFDGIGYSVFHDNIWDYVKIEGFSNISDVTAIGNRIFFTSIGQGLYDMQADIILNDTNSELVESGSGGVQLTSAIEYDESIWITSYDSPSPFYELASDGSVYSHTSTNVGTSSLLDVQPSQNGTMWMRKGSSGIAIYDPFNIQSRQLSTLDGLPSSSISGITITTSDEAWISTLQGFVSYPGASFPFNAFGLSKPIFNGVPLFENENITDVESDGGDRVWVSSDQGIWVFSRNFTELIHRFTSDNSPLLSDNVLQMEYDKESGKMIFLTDRGVTSYRSSSSEAGVFNKNRITVFPNPVPPGYTGLVGFSGLARNSTVKITDSKGRLVKKLEANGGTASWNLRSHTGAEISTGVYLVFSSLSNGKDTSVGKIAIIR